MFEKILFLFFCRFLEFFWIHERRFFIDPVVKLVKNACLVRKNLEVFYKNGRRKKQWSLIFLKLCDIVFKTIYQLFRGGDPIDFEINALVGGSES